MGSVESEAALAAHLAPDAPRGGGIVADASGDPYDVDFLASRFGASTPVDRAIETLAAERHLAASQVAELRRTAADRGVTAANAWFVLEQHSYSGDAARGRARLRSGGSGPRQRV